MALNSLILLIIVAFVWIFISQICFKRYPTLRLTFLILPLLFACIFAANAGAIILMASQFSCLIIVIVTVIVLRKKGKYINPIPLLIEIMAIPLIISIVGAIMESVERKWDLFYGFTQKQILLDVVSMLIFAFSTLLIIWGTTKYSKSRLNVLMVNTWFFAGTHWCYTTPLLYLSYGYDYYGILLLFSEIIIWFTIFCFITVDVAQSKLEKAKKMIIGYISINLLIGIIIAGVRSQHIYYDIYGPDKSALVNQIVPIYIPVGAIITVIYGIIVFKKVYKLFLKKLFEKIKNNIAEIKNDIGDIKSKELFEEPIENNNLNEEIVVNQCHKCGSEIVGRFCATCGYDSQKSTKNTLVIFNNKFFNSCRTFFRIFGKVCVRNILTTVVCATIIVSAISITAVSISLSTNIFRYGKVSDIELNMSKAEVEEILGEAHESDTYTWYYYEKSFRKKYEKINAEGKDLLNGDIEDIEDSFEKIDKIYSKLEAMEYKQIMVRFNSDGEVTLVFLDKKHKYSEGDPYSTVTKTLKDVELNTEEIQYFERVDDDGKITTYDFKGNENTVYTARYTDGSFYRTSLSIGNSNTTITGNTATLEWENELCSYKLAKTAAPIGKTNVDGTELLRLYIENDTDIVIPDGITSIDSGAFSGGYNLKSVTIPDSVMSIEYRTFERCSSLTDIYFTGTEDEWNAIIDKSGANILSSATIHYNYVPDNS